MGDSESSDCWILVIFDSNLGPNGTQRSQMETRQLCFRDELRREGKKSQVKVKVNDVDDEGSGFSLLFLPC